MTMAPYSRDAVTAAEMAVKAGAKVVAITDSDLSPLAAHADHMLVAATDTPSFFHSLIAANGVVETLVATLASRGGTKAVSAIRRTQDRLQAMHTYLEPPVRKATARKNT